MSEELKKQLTCEYCDTPLTEVDGAFAGPDNLTSCEWAPPAEVDFQGMRTKWGSHSPVIAFEWLLEIPEPTWAERWRPVWLPALCFVVSFVLTFIALHYYSA